MDNEKASATGLAVSSNATWALAACLERIAILALIFGITTGFSAAQSAVGSLLETEPAILDEIDINTLLVESLFLVDGFEELTEEQYEFILAEHNRFIRYLVVRPALDPQTIRLIPDITAFEVRILSEWWTKSGHSGVRNNLLEFSLLTEQTAAYFEFALLYSDTAAANGTVDLGGIVLGENVMREKPDGLSTPRKSRWTGAALMRIERQDKPGGNIQDVADTPEAKALRTTAKFSLRKGNFESSISVRNDPGEPFQWKPESGWYGFDRISGYVQWHPEKLPLRLTLGHYSIDFGQGLLWSRPFGQRRDASAPHRTLRHSSGIRGHSSSSGNAYLTGMAAEIEASVNTRVGFFLSRRKYDARLVNAPCLTECKLFPSRNEPAESWRMSSSDLHITEIQKAGRNAIQSDVIGAVLEQQYSTVALGVLSSLTSFNQSFSWNQRSAPVRSVHSNSIFAEWSARKIMVSGELSTENNVLSGAVLGTVFKPERRLRGIVLFRYINGQHSGLHSNASGFSTSLARQWGLVLGWRFVSSKKWKLSASIEFQTGRDRDATFPGSRYGTDSRIFAEVLPSSRVRIRAYYKQKRTLRKYSASTQAGRFLNYPEIVHVEQFSMELLYTLSNRLQVRLRTDVNTAKISSVALGTGFQMYQQFKVRATHRLFVTVRAAVFESDNTFNRIYIYEPDVTGKLSAPSVSGSGYYFFVLAKAQIVFGFRLEFKLTMRSYADTYFAAPKSGLRKEIDPQKRRHMTLQVSRRF